MNQSKYDETLKALNNAIQLDPQDADAWYNKGRILGIEEGTMRLSKLLTRLSRLIHNWIRHGTTKAMFS
jgi:cytochrome c-type biogenesis protein CcmH/NrfG